MFYPNGQNQLMNKMLELMRTIKDLQSASSLLGWDQETYMPSGSFGARAYQTSTLDSFAHKHLISDQAKDIAEKIRNYKPQLSAAEAAMFRLFVRDHDKAVRLPDEFVVDLSRVKTYAFESWKKARFESKFTLFEEDLKRLVDLKIREAEYLGYSGNRYNALLDQYEFGITTDVLTPMFNNLRLATVELTKDLQPYLNKVKNDFLFRKFAQAKQLKFSRFIAEKLGFDFLHGRLDESVHPFTTSFSSRDVRITTRVKEHDLRACVFGTIHETGHGLYEQGFDRSLDRTFAAEGSSLGIHESQSLLWENFIGRSREFWQWGFSHLKENFPNALADITTIDFYRAINKIEPSFVRVEADELTYNLHIIIRYEIEDGLINGKIRVSDVPEIWNEKMRENFGIVPQNDSLGCLQDIHWSFGGFGYFPTYTLGKLYAAMLWEKLQEDMPDLRSKIAAGQFLPIRNWLLDKIHAYGRLEDPAVLIRRVTGKDLSEGPFISYIRKKASEVYEFYGG